MNLLPEPRLGLAEEEGFNIITNFEKDSDDWRYDQVEYHAERYENQPDLLNCTVVDGEHSIGWGDPQENNTGNIPLGVRKDLEGYVPAKKI